MALYLYTANYTLDAVKALITEPQDREAAARQAITAAGVSPSIWRARPRCRLYCETMKATLSRQT